MYRILIADDEPIERMVISRLIADNYKEALQVYQAENGREATELYEKYKCQIVILDIEMPGITGLQAAEMIRRQDKTCQIIFLTAFDSFTYAKKAIAVKALEYLLKPVLDEEMIAVLDEAMRLCEEKCQPAFSPREEIENMITVSKGDQVRAERIGDIMQDFIAQHYREDISLQDAARALNYSEAYFCKLFKQFFHKGFIAYLSAFRVNKAKVLLEDITSNVKDISEQVGYRDPNYFAKVFKRIEGITPSEYRTLVLQEKIGALDKVQ